MRTLTLALSSKRHSGKYSRITLYRRRCPTTLSSRSSLNQSSRLFDDRLTIESGLTAAASRSIERNTTEVIYLQVTRPTLANTDDIALCEVAKPLRAITQKMNTVHMPKNPRAATTVLRLLIIQMPLVQAQILLVNIHHLVALTVWISNDRHRCPIITQSHTDDRHQIDQEAILLGTRIDRRTYHDLGRIPSLNIIAHRIRQVHLVSFVSHI